MEDTSKINTKKNRELDIIGVSKKVLSEKKLLIKFIIVFAVIGVIVALNTQKTYTANVVLAPEITSAGGMADNLSDLASMVGVNLKMEGNSVDAIYPEIYPEVFSSMDFIINLFDVKVRQEKDSVSKTYYNHIISDQKIPFWNYPQIWLIKLIKSFKKKGVAGKGGKINPFNLTEEQTDICNAIRGSIQCQVDKKTSIITISVTDFDRLVCATMADTLQYRLQQYITMYRTKKARNDLAYTEKLFKEAKAQYVNSQKAYGSYSDANQDLILESYKAKQEEYENEMQLRYNIYNQLAQQLQMAKAKVQERTPVFTIIQGPTVPVRASSLPRSTMVIISILLGIAVDALWVLIIRDLIKKRKTE